jgi:hypothetical protein
MEAVISEILQNIILFLELAFEKVRLVMWKNYICRTSYSPTKPNKNGVLPYLGISGVESQW